MSLKYSKTSLQKKTEENTNAFSESNSSLSKPAVSVLQKAAPEEELQMKADVVQKAAPEEELQMKTAIMQKAAPEEELQMKADVVQKAAPEEELQMKADIVQKAVPEEELQMKSAVVQKKENKTGMPDNLKSGIEDLSGMDMSDVKVHYNSSQPAQMQALAYAQGSDIHIGPGQEKHLPHEAWHVVQQRQGRVKPTIQVKGAAVNDDPGLENEADVMGAKAIQKMESPLQLQAAIDNRQTQIDTLQAALDGIPAGGANATVDEIALHDNAIGAGQHHRNRVVGRNALRADLQGRIDTLNVYQVRDNARVGNLGGQAAVQL